MKPFTANLDDEDTLRDLGRASVQIVHDLKNQLNGLKLYATFLRKRMEKAERPADELETIGKLIVGLERSAADMNVLVRLGRPVELQRRPGTDLERVLRAACEGQEIEVEGERFESDFDSNALLDAFRNMCEGTRALPGAAGELKVGLRREDGETPSAVIEWRGVPQAKDEDIFKSFAGSAGLKLALAARIIRAHGGEVSHDADVIRARMSLQK